MVIDAPMRAYYEARAAEYDDWWLGVGEFAKRDRPGWREEVEELRALVRGLPAKRTLDVACGTAFLTRELQGDEVVGLDQSPGMVAIARARGIDAVQGEAVPLPFPDGSFERLFTGHFYGHLLPGERSAFLAEAERVATGELVVVDSAPREDTPLELWQERKLNDGTVHKVFKRFFTGPALAAELGGADVLMDGRWFVAARRPLR